MSFGNAIILKLQSLLTLLSVTNDNRDLITDGVKECTLATRRICKAIRKASTMGEKQHLMATLANVKSLRRQFQQHLKQGTGYKKTTKHRVHWDDSMTAFESRIKTGIISNLQHKDVSTFLDDCKNLFRRRINNILKKHESVKVNMIFCGEFELAKADQVQTEFKYITTPNSAIYKDSNLNLWFETHIKPRILTELEEFQERNSGWSLKKIINLGININKFTPQLGSSYIDLPDEIKRKKACINVKNSDNACFVWAILSALFPTNQHPQRVNKYPHFSKIFNLINITFPMTIKQIPRFENQNNISINVYILKKIKKSIKVLPTYLTKDKKDKHVNLLLIQNVYYNEEIQEERDITCAPIRYHYVWIKDLSRLVSQQLSKNHNKKLFCDRCLHYFHSESRLKRHIEDCKLLNECKVKMPKQGENFLKFKNFKNKEKAPFVIYADIESVLKPVAEANKYQRHIAAAVGYYVKCSYDPSLSFYRSYRGEDSMQWFANEMKQFAEDVETVFICDYEMTPLTSKQKLEFNNATHCHICEKPFTVNDRKIRDHFHLSSENNYRGAAHNDCNVNYKDTHVIPIVFHNLSGYDSHFILKDIATKMEGQINVLPITKEKYISFSKHVFPTNICFKFIDSFRFMNASLDTLAASLQEFPILTSQFSNLTEQQILLLTRKGTMFYDYLDSFDKFSETELPPIEAFYNQLDDTKCSKKAYEHAQHIWENFDINNVGEYVELYMKTDIMLLAEIFEKFRESCRTTYGLDPAQYYTLPGYTWDCMLKYTNIELELLTDIDMIMFIERGTRGGLSQVSKRRAKANNKYMNTFDASQQSNYLMYFDINNQYGWAMSQSLPYGGFEWVRKVENLDVESIPDNASEGYILEVDLEYPKDFHDKHRDLPFCPEHFKAPNSKNKKLMATLSNKTRYVIHYRNLKQALSSGLKLSKIHRALKFKQSPWLKSYIDLNTNLRKGARNEFEKNLFKLMNNAVFGKTMENIRKHSIVKLLTKWQGRYGAEAMIAKPEFKSSTILDKNLVAIELNKSEIYFNKPIYIGMCILDIAKTTIYDFHYKYMAKTFGDNCSRLYTDTDSLIYEIRNHAIYDSIRRDCKQYFDTSDYSDDNIYRIPQVNKKVLGMMKDENNGKIMTDFIGLRSKLYTTKIEISIKDSKINKKLKDDGYNIDNDTKVSLNNGINKKAKGVKKSVVKANISFKDYVDCLENFTKKTICQHLIKAHQCFVHSVKQLKVALSPHDDKRYLIKGSYETLPWGHYSITV